MQALSSNESSEQKEFDEVVRPELTDEEKQCVEHQQLKQKAITEKDLVSQRKELKKKSLVLCCCKEK